MLIAAVLDFKFNPKTEIESDPNWKPESDHVTYDFPNSAGCRGPAENQLDGEVWKVPQCRRGKRGTWKLASGAAG